MFPFLNFINPMILCIHVKSAQGMGLHVVKKCKHVFKKSQLSVLEKLYIRGN